MTIISKIEPLKQKEIEVSDLEETGIDNEKLAALKAKMASKENTKLTKTEDKRKSIRFGVIGSGQAGSNLAALFSKFGYPAIALNTAQQDLVNVDLPESCKLHLAFGLGGAAKDLSIGNEAAASNAEAIRALVQQKLGDEQVLLFCTSLGGGSGAGSAEVVVDILAELQMPIIVVTVLPQAGDDAQVKHNSLQTLSRFTKMIQSQKICNLIVVDNAKIESIYSDVNPFNFFRVSNQAIVEPIDIFNRYSAIPSAVKPLDSTEFGKLFTDGQGLTVYGSMKVENYEDETAIASALIDNLSGNLLASGFDIKQAKYVGFMLVANEKVWSKIPQSSMTYTNHLLNDVCSNPTGIFKGIYSLNEIEEDCVTVYSMFSGLGLPTDRIEQLKSETKEKMAAIEKKDSERNLTLKLDVGESSVSAVDAIRQKIQANKSSFGKLHGKAIEDRRKK